MLLPHILRTSHPLFKPPSTPLPPRRQIRWRDLEAGLVRKLGSGSYGQVFQGSYMNADVAIKVCAAL